MSRLVCGQKEKERIRRKNSFPSEKLSLCDEFESEEETSWQMLKIEGEINEDETRKSEFSNGSGLQNTFINAYY